MVYVPSLYSGRCQIFVLRNLVVPLGSTNPAIAAVGAPSNCTAPLFPNSLDLDLLFMSYIQLKIAGVIMRDHRCKPHARDVSLPAYDYISFMATLDYQCIKGAGKQQFNS